MLTPEEFLSKVEEAVKTPSPSPPVLIEELVKEIKDVFCSSHHFLPRSFWPPDLSDRAKVEAKEVELRGQHFVLDDDDVVTVIRLSDCLNLNELECLRLLVAADLRYDRSQREQSEFFSRLWYMERKKLITALQTILEAIVLPRNLEQDVVASIQKCMQDLLNYGLRRQLISLLKHCYEQATNISGESGALSYIADSQDVYEEWIILAHCLFLSSSVVQPSPGDLTDVFYMLKDNVAALFHIGGGSDSQYPVICGLLFSIITPLLPASADAASAMTSVFPDVSSRNIFHETVMTSVGDAFQDGIIACVRLAWAIHLMIIEKNSSEQLQKIDYCLDTVFSNNAFQVFIDIYFKNVACKTDAEDVIHIYNASLHNLITTFLSLQRFQVKVEEVIDMTRMFLRGSLEEECKDLSSTKKAFERANKQTVSLLQFVCEIYKHEPQLLSAAVAEKVWCLGVHMWKRIGNYQVHDASLKLLCTLAHNENGAFSVFGWVEDELCSPFSWRNFFGFLKEYSNNGDCSLTEFPEDTGLIISFLHLLMVVLRNGNAVKREEWFPDVEPLFMFLSSGKLPNELEDKVKDAINTFNEYCPKKEAVIWSCCKKYNVQVGGDGSQRGKRPIPSSMELDDMGEPKPKALRPSSTELNTGSTSKNMGYGGDDSTTGAEYKDGPLRTYLVKSRQTPRTTDPAVAAAPITKIQKTKKKRK